LLFFGGFSGVLEFLDWRTVGFLTRPLFKENPGPSSNPKKIRPTPLPLQLPKPIFYEKFLFYSYFIMFEERKVSVRKADQLINGTKQ
jgi:hypothetical protein